VERKQLVALCLCPSATSDLKPRSCIYAPFSQSSLSIKALFIWDITIQKFYEQTKDCQRDLYTWDIMMISIKEHIVHLGYQNSEFMSKLKTTKEIVIFSILSFLPKQQH
jgi:hypothetical protein